MTLEENDSKKPFSVEYGPDPDADEWPHEKFFATAEEAQAFAEQTAKDFKAVTIAEYGTYETKKLKRKDDWMYYWWSKSTYMDEDPTGRGSGYPDWDTGALVSYTTAAN